MNYTKEQLKSWEKYERVRKSGKFNMFDVVNARMEAGLSREDYLFCMKNYSSLKEANENDLQIK